MNGLNTDREIDSDDEAMVQSAALANLKFSSKHKKKKEDIFTPRKSAPVFIAGFKKKEFEVVARQSNGNHHYGIQGDLTNS